MTAATTPRGPLLANTVLIDTNIWSRLYLSGSKASRPEHKARYQQVQTALSGKTIVIAAQTRAELLTYPAMRQMAAQREAELIAKIDATPTIPFGPSVEAAWVKLTAACKAGNHQLGFKEHIADRWIAATAIAYDLPLYSEDTGYGDAPLLTLFP